MASPDTYAGSADTHQPSARPQSRSRTHASWGRLCSRGYRPANETEPNPSGSIVGRGRLSSSNTQSRAYRDARPAAGDLRWAGRPTTSDWLRIGQLLTPLKGRAQPTPPAMSGGCVRTKRGEGTHPGSSPSSRAFTRVFPREFWCRDRGRTRSRQSVWGLSGVWHCSDSDRPGRPGSAGLRRRPGALSGLRVSRRPCPGSS